ncbi:hypothetical protein TRFO_04850 [Tritrichomonas foetus]|uniref:Uncharacterized protein n=1 Tax=Tritrichomonas foetus TaxID=1144522 RepID=A0A1J4KBZ3_9EUKA|nr:hypothetical protein TRFO_04850 [Tritrichomonas foetus]|eukprot:OHT08739.1 hypothetical protein TRFO_04850 [Tritrichomonas foetus]
MNDISGQVQVLTLEKNTSSNIGKLSTLNQPASNSDMENRQSSPASSFKLGMQFSPLQCSPSSNGRANKLSLNSSKKMPLAKFGNKNFYNPNLNGSNEQIEPLNSRSGSNSQKDPKIGNSPTDKIQNHNEENINRNEYIEQKYTSIEKCLIEDVGNIEKAITAILADREKLEKQHSEWLLNRRKIIGEAKKETNKILEQSQTCF